MIEPWTLLTILAMGSVTYLTRALGYLVLRHRTLDGRARAVMEAAPGCVLVAVIAPFFVSGQPADLIALALTLLVSLRCSMLPTVLVGVIAAGVLRQLAV